MEIAHPRSHYRRLLLSVGKVGSGMFGCAMSLVVYLASLIGDERCITCSLGYSVSKYIKIWR
ncbi:hypothetical protein BDV41DRAFT_219248 [Aspergillus transmontanensis]|uniref:Uncharacterized protein n=1 Tax=Aspergillus transmontanensis TaxID=1034304 RepID=A0A5N6W072_9EURO|nr:hypothetical protein BDV41DRAFT_219248 [Aspergillus transmontanensis]